MPSAVRVLSRQAVLELVHPSTCGPCDDCAEALEERRNQSISPGDVVDDQSAAIRTLMRRFERGELVPPPRRSIPEDLALKAWTTWVTDGRKGAKEIWDKLLVDDYIHQLEHSPTSIEAPTAAALAKHVRRYGKDGTETIVPIDLVPAMETALPSNWASLRRQCFRRDEFRCQWCDRVEEARGLDAHHIVPRSEGGLNDLSNLITLCKRPRRGKNLSCHDQVEVHDPPLRRRVDIKMLRAST